MEALERQPLIDEREEIRAPTVLVDGFGRRISYLRLSVTDRCDMRCTYCMGDKPEFMPSPARLSLSEIAGIGGAFIDRGIRTIRLTGGEPLVRSDIVEIASALGQRLGHGLDQLTMTTNGTLLDRYADKLIRAGIRRINISLDTLDPALFPLITRGGRIDRVFSGISAAKAAGFAIRINMVAMAGTNDSSLLAMADWCEAEGFDLALIESMPMGEVGAQRANSHISLHEFIRPLAAGDDLIADPHRTTGPARYYSIKGRQLRLGLISPISNNFCAGCNRVRLSADGKVHGCLGHDDSLDLAAAWRSGGRDALDPRLDRLMATKIERHSFRIGPGTPEQGPARRMNLTGG